MRKLQVDAGKSSEKELVLRDDEGTEYSVSISEELRTLVTAPPAPRPASPLTLRPRDIQDRVRAGASIEELAEEMGVDPARVEPYAHPVILERQAVAERGRQAHPVLADGPATTTLWESLATAFAARGHTLADATWDAYKDSGVWILRLRWSSGLSDNQAEWVLTLSSPPTVEARDAVASDLTDPDFAKPARTLTPVSMGEREEETEEGEEFLKHPEEPTRRRRTSVTPHWEDVLLGVRANTKRPRS